MVIEFFLPMEHVPTVTHQEQKVKVVNGKPIFFDPPELKSVRQKYQDALARHRPSEKLTGPLELTVIWCFLTDRHENGSWRITKPDTDNLQKLLKDCMTHVGFWLDDAQVCREVVEKRWVTGPAKQGAFPGIWISIKQMEIY